MVQSTIDAARLCGARIVLPGNVYNYGTDAFPLIDETAPQSPVTRKGEIRVEMERRLRDAASAGVPVLIVRAGDFFGPGAGNNWFSQGMIRQGKPVSTIYQPGRPGVGHQWAYLPDVAQTIVELLERDLDTFATFHMGGHWDPDGTRMVRAIEDVAGTARVRRFPWWLMRIAAPFVTTVRELLKMRYLWQTPVQLDNTKLVAELGREPHTPWEQAVRETLVGLGCLEDQADESAAISAAS